MGVPYEIQPMAGIQVPGGQTKTVKVRFAPRAWINKIVIQETGNATPVPFEVELFNHLDALEGTEVSSSDDSGDGEEGYIPLALRKIGQTLASTSPGLLEYYSEFTSGGAGLVFVNMDPQTNNRRQPWLYVRITAPVGAGDRTYALAVGGEVFGD